MPEIRLRVAGDEPGDERCEQLTSRLQAELRELGVRRVTQPAAAAPGRAKGDVIAWAELAVAVSGSLPVTIGAIRSWRKRQRGATVTIECDGDRLVLDDATADEQTALVDAWLARHDDG